MKKVDKCIYVGEYQHTLDSKMRLTIPAKWRFEGDEEEVYLALPNPVGCISVYPPKMVEKLHSKVEEVSLGNVKGQRALAKLFSQADSFGCDKQGRVRLADKLREHAQLGKEVVLVGNFVTFNIWEKDAYERYLNETGEEPEDNEIATILTELGV